MITRILLGVCLAVLTCQVVASVFELEFQSMGAESTMAGGPFELSLSEATTAVGQASGGPFVMEAGGSMLVDDPELYLITAIKSSVNVGESAVLEIEESEDDLGYQWYEGVSGDASNPVPGATGPLLVTYPLKENTQYWVRVTRNGVEVDSEAIEVSVISQSGDYDLRVMGENRFGELGLGTGDHSPFPHLFERDVIAVSAGYEHTLFVKNDRTLWALGSNAFGQLGDGTTTDRPTPVLVSSDVASVSAGRVHSLFVKTDGTLWAMGANSSGQLGDGTTTDRLTPIQVASDVVSASGGKGNSSHSLFVKTDGSLWAMGLNLFGQLGDGTTMGRLEPIQVSSDVISMATCSSHSLFVKTDGTLWAMGSNSFGQLGDGTTTNRLTPIEVASDVVTVSAGSFNSFFVKADGTLWAMGNNYDGQLGVGATDREYNPDDFSKYSEYNPVKISNDVISVDASGYHSVFVKADGTLWGMGNNRRGQLGDGTVTRRPVPVLISNNVREVSVGGSYNFYTLILKTDGTLWGTGDHQDYYLEDEFIHQWSSPVQVVSGVSKVSTYTHHTLFVKADGTLWAMGDNEYGQLGDGTVENRYTPVWVENDVVDVSAGVYHTLFVKADGTLWAVGNNEYGQLGDGTRENRYIPVQVSSDVLRVSTRYRHTHFVKKDGTLWAMGDNEYGQLGDGTSIDRLAPVQISTGVGNVSAGSTRTLFTKTDGTLWETRSHLQDDGYSPVQISSGVVSFSSGNDHSLFVKADGTLWGVGGNRYGQLGGDGSMTNRGTPVQISSDVINVDGAYEHTLFVKTDGTLWAMGRNNYGQLGNGSMMDRSTPVQIANGVVRAITGHHHSLYLVRKAFDNVYSVAFDLDEQSTRLWGGLLDQEVLEGTSAVPPLVQPASGWNFAGWDMDFSAVTEDITVKALYTEQRAEIELSSETVFDDESTLNLGLGGTVDDAESGRQDYDVVKTMEPVILDGQLQLQLVHDFKDRIQKTDRFTIVSAPSGGDGMPGIRGRFNNITHNGRVQLADGSGSFEVVITDNTVEISDFQAAPESMTKYDAWRWQKYADFDAERETAVWGDTVDLDTDNVSNLFEYAFDLDPEKPDVIEDVLKIEKATDDEGNPVHRIQLVQRKPGDDPNLRYCLMRSSNLDPSTWVDATDEASVKGDPVSLSDTTEQLTYEIPFLNLQPGEVLFWRVNVEQSNNE